jgi:hypothetical protein
MPLRLWAGVGMLMAPNGWHHTPTPTSAPTPISLAVATTGTQAAPAQAGHDCHEAVTLASHEAPTHTTHVADHGPQHGSQHGPQTADCQDGACQLCGVCHQTASLMPWVLGVPLIQIHPQPIGAFVAPLAQPAQPLIKPPIS